MGKKVNKNHKNQRITNTIRNVIEQEGSFDYSEDKIVSQLGIVDRIEIPKVISGMSRTMVIAGNKPKTPNKKEKK